MRQIMVTSSQASVEQVFAIPMSGDDVLNSMLDWLAGQPPESHLKVYLVPPGDEYPLAFDDVPLILR